MDGNPRAGALGRLDVRADQAGRWSRDQPTECLALGLTLMVSGAALLALAVRTSSLGTGVAGIAAAVGGLTALNERFAIAGEHHPLRWLALGVVATGIGVAVILQAFVEDAAPAAALGVLVAIVGLLPVGNWLRMQGEGGRWWLAPAGLVVIAVGGASRVPLVIAVGVVAGLTMYKVGLRRGCESWTGARIATWGGLAATVVGSGAVLIGSQEKRLDVALAGTGLLLLGLTAMSVGWLKLGRRPFTGYWALGFGAGVVAVGGIAAAAALGGALVLALLVAVVGGSLVWRGEALVVAVLIGSSFVWLTFDRTADDRLDPRPEATQRILALGDSYMSGEGAPHFFAGTNVKGAKENECRRAATAYPYLVAKGLDMGLDFYACSGAKADQLHLRGQAPERSPDAVFGERPQLDNLPADVSNIGLILVGIGGNDAQFGDIGQGCVLPGSCDALRDVWMTNLDQIGTQITEAYTAIKKRLPGVPVVAVPYPLMLKDTSCSWSRLDGREHAFIAEFVVVLNDRVRVAAEKAGVHFVSPEMFAFDGAKICDGESSKDTVMNFLSFNPVQGSFLERISPRNWIHGSLHPRPAGHERTAAVLTPFLKSLLADIKAGKASVNPMPYPAAAFTFRNVRGTTPQLVKEADRPVNVPCLTAGEAVDPFGTRVRLFDEVAPFPISAAPGSPMCFTGADGAWIATVPSAQNPAATIADGLVYVRPVLPAGKGKTQQVVFKGLDGRWQLRSVDFCSRDSTCPTGIGNFQNEQLGRAAQVAVPPLLILLLGGWLFAAGTSRKVSDFRPTSRP